MSGPWTRGHDDGCWLTGWPDPCVDETVRPVASGKTESASRPGCFSPSSSSSGARPSTRDEKQASSSNLKAMSSVSMTSPVHTKKGSPASSSFACSTKPGRGTGLMADGGAAWRRCRLASFVFFPGTGETSKLSGPRHEMMSTAGRPGWANELPHLRSASKGGCQDQRSQALLSLLLTGPVPHHLHAHRGVSCFRDLWKNYTSEATRTTAIGGPPAPSSLLNGSRLQNGM